MGLKLKELSEKLKKLEEKYPRLSTAMTLAEDINALLPMFEFVATGPRRATKSLRVLLAHCRP